eukprot:jgi/Tetstr1/447889/TSEL_035198.t1
MAGSDGYDTEEEFARELAALGDSAGGLSDSDSGSDAGGYGGSSEEEDWEEGGSAEGGDVLQSLAAYRARLAAEDGKLSAFTQSLREVSEAREWQDVRLPVADPKPPAAAAAADYQLPEPGGDQRTTPAPPPPCSEDGDSRAGGEEAGAATEQGEDLGDERHAVWREFEAADARREAGRRAERQAAELEAARQREEAAAATAAAAAELEAAAAARMAELEAAAAARTARLEAEMAAEAAEQAEAEAAEEALAHARASAAAAAAAEAAARQAERDARESERRERLGAAAARLVAARRVWRGWRRYRASAPRAARREAVVRCQAIAQGRAARTEAGRRRRARDALVAMEAARAKGDAAALRKAAAAAEALGLGEAAAAEVAAYEAAAAGAAGALSRAAASGDVVAFRAALIAASKYGAKLGGLLGEAEAQFGARQAAALRRVETLAEQGTTTMVRLQDLIRAAVALGANAVRLRAAEARVSARDAAAADALNAAVCATPLDLTAVARCLEAAESFGLYPDASAARQRLAHRQAKAATGVQEVAAAGSAAEFAAAATEASSLGLADSVAQAQAKFARRRAAALKDLAEASSRGTCAQVEATLAKATLLGASAEELGAQAAVYDERRASVAESLAAAAHSGTAAQFSAASAAAAEFSLTGELAAATEALRARTEDAMQALAGAAAMARAELVDHGNEPSPAGEGSRLESGRWASTSASDVCTAHFGDDDHRQPLGAAHWAGLLDSGQPSAALSTAVQRAERAAGSLGLGSAWDASWAAVATAAAVAHATGRGRVASVDATADDWGRPVGGLKLAPGPEVAALGDPLAALARGDGASRTPGVLLWPQPLDVGTLAAAWEAWRGEEAPAEETESEEEGEAAAADGDHSAKGVAEEEGEGGSQAGGLQPNAVMLQAACSPGVALADVASLDLSLEGLAGLAGLAGACPRLRALNAGVNRLTSLAGLPVGIEELNVRENRLAGGVTLAGLRSLRVAILDANRLRSLAGLAGPNLRRLSLAGNQLAALSGTELAGAPLLECLNLAGNRLTSLCGLLRPLGRLAHLDVSGNRMAALHGLRHCPRLLSLRAGGNALAQPPDVSACGLLRELQLQENRLTAPPALPWHPHLVLLNLQDNRLPVAPRLGGCPRLRELNVSFNRLADAGELAAALSGVTSLTSLQVTDNPAASDPATSAALLRALPWLTELDHDAVEPAAAQAASLAALASAPLAAPALLRAQSAANRPLLGAVPSGGSVRGALAGLPAARLQALARHRQAGELFGSAQAALPAGRVGGGVGRGWLAAVEAEWAHHTAVGLAAAQAAQAPDAGESWAPAPAPPLHGSSEKGRPGTADIRDAHWEQAKREPLAAHQGVLQLQPEYAARLDAVRAAAATALQAHRRRALAVRLRVRLEVERHDAALNASARTVQAVWRGRSCRRSEALRVRRAQHAERQQRAAAAHAAAQAQRCSEAATRMQALGRGWRVRRRVAAAREAARYIDERDAGDSFDFDEELDLDFIKPPEGMSLDATLGKEAGEGDAITVDMLDGWGAPAAAAPALPAGPLSGSASSSRQFAAGATSQPPPHHGAAERRAPPDNDDGGDGGSVSGYSHEALERRRASGGALVPSLQRSASGRPLVAVPPGDMEEETGEGEEEEEEKAFSPTRSVPESHSNMSYGSSLKDEERRAKLKVKMDKVAGEWGFENSATAEAFYRAQQKRLRSQKKKSQAKKYADPQKRLEKLKHQMEGKPQLHPAMFQRNARPAGPALQLQRGAVEGPASREGGQRAPRPPCLPAGGARSADRANRRVAEAVRLAENKGGACRRRALSFDGDAIPEERASRSYHEEEDFLRLEERHHQGPGTATSDPGWREFQTDAPNLKLARSASGSSAHQHHPPARAPPPGHPPPRVNSWTHCGGGNSGGGAPELDGITGRAIAAALLAQGEAAHPGGLAAAHPDDAGPASAAVTWWKATRKP